jgi:RNA polymerase sigma factor (sigma-70 family)
LGDLDLANLRQKLRFRVGYQLGFTCPDIEDVVQEALRRFLDAEQSQKLRTPEAAAGFVNGICRNVILEYRRRLQREAPMPETAPELPENGLPEGERFELREAVEAAMNELSPRDRSVLRSFYLEERTPEEISAATGLTLENFRVVLCRAKERFRQIYRRSVQYGAGSGH